MILSSGMSSQPNNCQY